MSSDRIARGIDFMQGQKPVPVQTHPVNEAHTNQPTGIPHGSVKVDPSDFARVPNPLSDPTPHKLAPVPANAPAENDPYNQPPPNWQPPRGNPYADANTPELDFPNPSSVDTVLPEWRATSKSAEAGTQFLAELQGRVDKAERQKTQQAIQHDQRLSLTATQTATDQNDAESGQDPLVWVVGPDNNRFQVPSSQASAVYQRLYQATAPKIDQPRVGLDALLGKPAPVAADPNAQIMQALNALAQRLDNAQSVQNQGSQYEPEANSELSQIKSALVYIGQSVVDMQKEQLQKSKSMEASRAHMMVQDAIAKGVKSSELISKYGLEGVADAIAKAAEYQAIADLSTNNMMADPSVYATPVATRAQGEIDALIKTTWDAAQKARDEQYARAKEGDIAATFGSLSGLTTPQASSMNGPLAPIQNNLATEQGATATRALDFMRRANAG